VFHGDMTTFDRSFWEERWSQVLREHADQVADRPPDAHLSAEVGNLRPGFAVDAGCGHGSDTLWLAARGWPGHCGLVVKLAELSGGTVGVSVHEIFDNATGTVVALCSLELSAAGR
jgi:hypothetical protein